MPPGDVSTAAHPADRPPPLLEPFERWLPPTPTARELAAGLAGGLFGACSAPLLTGPVQQILGKVAGRSAGPRATAAAERGDPGWFGPDSVAWRIHADPSMLIAGIAAFALQSLHPSVITAVVDHSGFSRDFYGRTQRTGQFVQGVVYGSSAHAEELCAMVRRMHRPVLGVLADGTPYDANDPELLAWVHVTEYVAIAAANRRFGLHPMTEVELDEYVASVARVGLATGVSDPPRSWDDALAALEHHRPQLSVSEYAALGVHFLHRPTMIPAAAQPLWQPLWAGAVAVLPPIARRLLGLSEPSTAALARCRAVLRTVQQLADFTAVREAALARVAGA